jgi:hypothetical protein
MSSMLLVSITFWTSKAAAQSEPRSGEQVRGKIIQPVTAALGAECTGAVQGVERDTIIVSSSEGCPRESHLGDLRVARGSRGSRLVHAVAGSLVGGITGAVAARTRGRGRCENSGCVGDDQAYVAGIRTMVYAAAGMAVGAGLGAALPAGPRWIRTAVGRPVRVAGMALRPEVRLSLLGSTPQRRP